MKSFASFEVFSKRSHKRLKLKFRPGEIVEVKGKHEIALTLDRHGAYEGLLFTAEMRKICGKRFKVLRRVNKLIVEGIGGMRQIKDAVILDGVICSGEYHDGCGKSCPLIWKEAWLKRVDSKDEKPSEHIAGQINVFNEEMPGCQAVSLIGASTPIKAWNFMHYFWELNSEDGGGTTFLKTVIELLKFRAGLHIRPREFDVRGKRKTTPVEVLDLKPGEIVEVKSREGILETLDSRGRNRGLQFIPEMLKHCGKRFRVLRRVGKMVVNEIGEMRLIPNTVILDGVYCDGRAHGGCQRMCFCLWREIWLRRVKED